MAKWIFTFCVSFTLLLSFPSFASSYDNLRDNNERKVFENRSHFPVIFRENKGQWDEKILFQGSATGTNVYFLKDRISYAFIRENENSSPEHPDSQNNYQTKNDDYQLLVWNTHFIGSNPNVTTSADGKTDSHTNYLIGDNPDNHVTNVPDYSVFKYHNIYQNIDLRYYGNGNELKYDYIIHPGASIKTIQMACEGIQQLGINRKGELEINTAWGTLTEKKPYSYQFINNVMREVDVRYELLNDTTFGFKIYGNYDSNQDIIIDPIILNWSTFLGSNDVASKNCYLFGLARDNAGFLYGVGRSPNSYTTVAGLYPYAGGVCDVLIFKMTEDGKNMIYATYFGGSQEDAGQGIAVNPAGEVFIAGYTNSANLPQTAGNYQPSNKGGYDIFVLKLNAAGTAPVFCTYIGGTGTDLTGGKPGTTASEPDRNEVGNPIAINAAGEIYVAGWTGAATVTASNFPSTSGGFNNWEDAVTFKLSNDGKTLLFSDIYGGSDFDRAKGIAVDASGNAYVTGYTSSVNFPSTPAPSGNNRDIFIRKYGATGNVIYSFLAQGNKDETSMGIAVNASGEAFVTGRTTSTDFKKGTGTGAFGGGTYSDAFVLKLNAVGNNVVYASYLGGNGGDLATGIAVSSANEAFVAGITQSADFPVECEFDNTVNPPTTFFGVTSTPDDIFVAKLSATGTLEYGTYIGGKAADYGSPKIVLKEDPCVIEAFVSLTSHSDDFPTVGNVYQTVKPNSNYDQPTVFSLKPVITPDFEYTPTPSCSATPVQFTDKSTGQCIWKPGNWKPDSWSWDFGDGGTSTLQNPIHVYAAPGNYTVTLKVSCPDSTIKKMVTIPAGGGNLYVNLGKDTAVCGTPSITLNAGNPGAAYSWSPGGASTQTINVTAPGQYIVEVTNSPTCKGKDTINITTLPPPNVNLNYIPVCEGDTVTLDAGTPGSVYLWSTNATTQKIKITQPNKYWVTVGSGACSAKDTLDVTFVKAPLVSIRDTFLCPGASVTITVQGNGTSYLWHDNSTNTSITVNAGGKIWVRGDNGTCDATDTAIVTMGTLPVVSLRDSTVCIGTPVTYDAGNPGATYLWGDGTTSQTITVYNTGPVTVTVTNAQGCTASASANVNALTTPVVSLGNDTAFCTGTVINLLLDAGNPGATYTWNTAGVNTQTYTATGPGKYWVTANNTICKHTDTISITLLPLPVIIPFDSTICNGEQLVLDPGNIGNSYVWSTGVNTQSITVANNGAYSVTVIDANNCSSSATYNVSILPIPVVNLGNDTVICITPISLKLNAENTGSTFLWNTGATSQFINVSSPGTYSVKVSNQFCSSMDTITIDEGVNVQLGDDISLCEATVVTLDAGNQFGASYTWSTDETTSAIGVIGEGKYWVEVTKGHCNASDTIEITGGFGESILYTPNAFTPGNDALNNVFIPYGNNVTSFQMYIFDRWGMLYYETNDMNKGWNGKLNGTLVQQDVYVYKIIYESVCGGKPIKREKVGHVSVIR